MVGERADPAVSDAVFEVFPFAFVFGSMMVSAQWSQIAGAGGPTVDDGYPVVDVALDGWHTTAGVDTAAVLGLDRSFHRHGGSAAGGAYMHYVAGFAGDGGSPF